MKAFISASCLFLLMSCGQKSSSQNAPESLEPVFSDLGPGEDQISAMDLGSSLKSRLVKVNLKTLKKLAAGVKIGEIAPIASKVILNLFSDETLDVLINEVEKVAADNMVYSGQIAGDLESGVSLVINDGIMVANIRYGDRNEVYEVRYVGNKVHSINLRKDDPQDDCVEVDSGVAKDEVPEIHDDQAQAGSVIDILGAYTPYARTKAGGTSAVVALIQLGISDTNAALGNSGLLTRVRLVGTMELKRNETGNWYNDIGYLSGKTDGIWDEVHAKRVSVGADQVTVVAVYPYQSGTNGIGYTNSSYAKAFTIVRNTSFGSYTLSHELGHNLGLNHSDGYVSSTGKFRTIIAYGSYPRIRRYSNPNRTYNGYRTGDSTHNEVKIIANNAAELAALSPTKM